MANLKAEEQKGRGTREKVATAQRLKPKAQAGMVADWISVDPVLLQQAIAAWAAQDGALRFGYSRDGGAFSIGVYGDGDPHTEYFGPNDDIEGYLRDIIESGN